MSASSIAANRFGYGLKSGEAAPAKAADWLKGQISRFVVTPSEFAALAKRAEVATQLVDYLDQVRNLRQQEPKQAEPAMDAAAAPKEGRTPAQEMRRMAGRAGRNHYQEAVAARFAAAVASDTPFAERLVHFWANHFAVSADKLTVVGLSGWLEFEAIRPNIFGRFADMLNAVERHPAMLLYLDQAQSIGPNSPIGARISARGVRQVGLNENLAREILELHTLGVRTGYGQADVTEFARALTGWTVSGISRGPIARLLGADTNPGDFVFVAQVHEPGARKIIGKSYPQQGEAQAAAILSDLALHPATARHIATKLARHFAGDAPPAALIARLEKDFLKTGGDLTSLYAVLIASPEVWTATAAKFKTPWDWAVSAMRASGAGAAALRNAPNFLNELGQPTWRPKSPAGYDDVMQSWAGPDALYRRVEAAERLVRLAPAGVDPRALGQRLFPGTLSDTTAQAISRAESPQQGLALLLCSPEFMRR